MEKQKKYEWQLLLFKHVVVVSLSPFETVVFIRVYGARNYDPRIGRWLSIDKSAKLQPGWSPFKAFLDNPISYNDPDGNTEFESITINDQRTGKSITISRVISTDVFKSGIRSHWEGQCMVRESIWSDKIHHTTYTIDKKGNLSVEKKDEFGAERTTTSGPVENFQWYANLKVNASDWDKSFEGDGGTQNGGFVFTSEDGGASPTKYKSRSYAEERDIGDLLTVLGTLGGGEASMLGKASTGSPLGDKLKDLSDIVQDAAEVIDLYKKGKDPDERPRFCITCGRTFSNGKVVETDNVPKDTIDANDKRHIKE